MKHPEQNQYNMQNRLPNLGQWWNHFWRSEFTRRGFIFISGFALGTAVGLE